MVSKPPRLVYVDTKEATNHPDWFNDAPVMRAMPGTFIAENLKGKERALGFGDIQIDLEDSNPFNRHFLVLELKTWPDLHASVRDTAEGRADSRIRHQLTGLLELQEAGHEVGVLVSGVVTKAGGATGRTKTTKAPRRSTGVYVDVDGRRVLKSWSFFELEQIRFAIQRLGIPVYQSPSVTEIPHAIRLILEAVERKEHFPQPGLARRAVLGPRHSFLVTCLTAVPDVGVETALVIAAEYQTFELFYHTATVEGLVKLPGIGKLTAQKIYSAWHGADFDPKTEIKDFDPFKPFDKEPPPR